MNSIANSKIMSNFDTRFFFTCPILNDTLQLSNNKGDNIMARGKRNYTLEEKLQIVTTDIANTKLCLQKLEEEKKELEIQIKQQRLEEIDKLMVQNGKTFDDVMAFLVG